MPYLYFYRRGQEMLHLDLGQLIRPDEPLVVGSERGTYVIPEPGVAPTQFEIAMAGEHFRLTDRSGERTEVDGEPVDSVQLHDGARIKLGGFMVYFHTSVQQGFGDDSAPQTLTEPFGEGELPRELWLTAQRKAGGAPVRVLFKRQALIGSGSACTLRLEGATVSAQHVELIREDNVVRLRDQASTNGTWIGPVRVDGADLPLGTRFRVGEWELWLTGPAEVKANAARPVMTAGGLVTADPGMLALLQRADAIAHSDCPVLILGETGTGKELFAQAIHERSRRAGQKMITFSCGLGRSPENLATQLCGHTKGAFTGADQAAPGTLGAADGGTVFFDELKCLPLALQPTLLRAVSEGEIHPLGAPEPRRVDVRFIAATQDDLVQAIRDREFREDLYWRFALAVFTLPPLRQRKGDIPILWDHFVQKLWGGKAGMALTDAARQKLMDHDWPGNVRELWNVVNRVLLYTPDVICDAPAIVFDASLLAQPAPARGEVTDPHIPLPTDVVHIKGKTLAQVEAALLTAVMRSSKGSRAEAVRRLDIDRKTLLKMLKDYNLEDVGVEGEAPRE
jgi:DNA-binding NtrC family response regulator